MEKKEIMKVVGYLVVFAMCTLSASIFVVDNGMVTVSGNSSLDSNEIVATLQANQEVKFNGTAIEYFSSTGSSGWNVQVDELISGPAEIKGHTATVALWQAEGVPSGTMDPEIEPGDKVEVYGLYIDEDYVTLSGSKDYHIKKMGTGARVELPSDRDWRQWGYDLAGTHFYPFPSTSPVKLNDFTELWNKSGRMSVLTGDINGDNFSELVTTNGSMLCVFDKNGKALWSTDTDASLYLLADVTGNGVNEILLAKRVSGSEGEVYIYDGAGNLLKTLKGAVGYDGWITPVAASDFDNDGMIEVAVRVAASYSANPRGLYMFNYVTGDIGYYYAVGPSGGIQGGDIDGDGKIEFVLGGGSWHNGGKGCGVHNTATGTTDSDIWTIAFNAEDGTEVFTLNYFGDGKSEGFVNHAIVDLDHDGDRNILSFEGHSHWYPGTVQVHLINENGTVLKTWDGPYISAEDAHYAGWAVGDVNNDGFDEIIIHFRDGGTLWLLDPELNEITSIPWGVSSGSFVINDINGDGTNEILAGDPNVDKVRVFNSDLNEIWGYKVSGDPDIVLSDLNNDGINEIIVAADKLYVLAVHEAGNDMCVTDDYLTIQQAVDVAQSRETIVVSDGTYSENVKVNMPHIAIRSENGADKTTVQAKKLQTIHDARIKCFKG